VQQAGISPHAPVLVRATSSAPRDRSSWARARDSRACAWSTDTPSTAATSAADRPCLIINSKIWRLPGLSASAAAQTSSRTWQGTIEWRDDAAMRRCGDAGDGGLPPPAAFVCFGAG
jgi:hypothetical protein